MKWVWPSMAPGRTTSPLASITSASSSEAAPAGGRESIRSPQITTSRCSAPVGATTRPPRITTFSAVITLAFASQVAAGGQGALEPVTDEVRGHDHEEDRHAGERRVPPVAHVGAATDEDHRSPLGRGWLGAEADEGQGVHGEDRVADVEAHL